MNDAILSSAIMPLAFGMFVSDRIRPDAVALTVLLLAWFTGLLGMDEAIDGFASKAVLTVAAVLVVGRVMEFTGAGAMLTRWMVSNAERGLWLKFLVLFQIGAAL